MKRIAVLLLALSTPLGTGTAESQGPRRINVLGRATIEAAPDFATVTVGVSTKAATPTAALDQNSAVVRRVVTFSTRFGVEARDVQTTAVQLREETRQVVLPNGRASYEPDGYRAENSVRVRVRNLARFGEYVRDVIGTGANRINEATFGLSNVEQVADEARAVAVEDAARKARRLAEAAGVKLGPLQQITHPPKVEYRAPDGFADLPRRAPSMLNVPIEAGTLEIAAEVDVTWLVE